MDPARVYSLPRSKNTSAFVDGSCEGVFVAPLEKYLGELIVLHQCHFGFVGCGRHVKFFVHGRSGVTARALRKRTRMESTVSPRCGHTRALARMCSQLDVSCSNVWNRLHRNLASLGRFVTTPSNWGRGRYPPLATYPAILPGPFRLRPIPALVREGARNLFVTLRRPCSCFGLPSRRVNPAFADPRPDWREFSWPAKSPWSSVHKPAHPDVQHDPQRQEH